MRSIPPYPIHRFIALKLQLHRHRIHSAATFTHITCYKTIEASFKPPRMANWFLFSMFTCSVKASSIETSLGKLRVATHSLHYAILELHVHVSEDCNTSV